MTPDIGKKINSNVWVHVSAFDTTFSEFLEHIQKAEELSGLTRGDDYNVIKFDSERNIVTFLDYIDFFEVGFPILCRYWRINIEENSIRFRTYEESLNPPVLHRKELLLQPTDPRIIVYSELTASAEQIGLFDDPKRIGFKRSWDELLVRRGYKVVGNSLIPIGNDENSSADDGKLDEREGIARHRTALVRYALSAPIQTLERFGYLDGSKTIFDYGCGRGDDIRGLVENDIIASGWDPYHAPKKQKKVANIVNLGFVINVIEDIDERIEAITSAYELADDLMVVSAMLSNQESIKGTPYSDGVITSRNTFQKYYTQNELGQFISDVLDTSPIPVSPGIFYVFKNKDEEQRFLYSRQSNRRNILRLSSISRSTTPLQATRAEEKYQEHRALLETLWEQHLTLGRSPKRSEVSQLDVIQRIFGSLPSAIRFIQSRKEKPVETIAAARESRINDLLVYFALLHFERRKPYSQLEARLKIDIKEFFGNYKTAVNKGKELLFRISDTDEINDACKWSDEHGIGCRAEDGSLQLHTSLVTQLPAVLRVYIGCGTHMYGDTSSADLIKVHSYSGKLTLINFDDFENNALPRMVSRVKLNLRNQNLDIFDYVDQYPPPYLYKKSRFTNEEFPHYPEQIAFEDKLDTLGLLDCSGYGPSPEDFDRTLSRLRYVASGYELLRSEKTPDIDSHCGKYFSFRDLIECGETQAKTGIANLPKQADSYSALLDLTVNILDPVIDYFGMIKLTYGFCSQELSKKIPGRIAPKLDQHIAHEKNRLGNYVCSRLGAAVDFLVEDEDMNEVALWVAENTPFDRLYYYGANKPIHISYGPDNSRMFVDMINSNGGRLIPKKRTTIK